MGFYSMAQNHLADIIICRSASYLTQQLHTDLLQIRKSDRMLLEILRDFFKEMDVLVHRLEIGTKYLVCVVQTS